MPTGPPPTRTTSARNIASIVMMRFSSTRSPVSESVDAPSRVAQPNRKRFTVRRIAGGGDLWVSELVATYDARPFHVVGIMEFEEDMVVRETQYFGEPFEAGASRAQWVEPIG